MSGGHHDEQKQTEIVSGPVKKKTVYSHVRRWELECMSVHDPEVVVIECESQLWRSDLGKILLVQQRVYHTPVQQRSNLNRPFGAVRMPNSTHGKSAVQLGPVSRACSDATVKPFHQTIGLQVVSSSVMNLNP